MRKITSIVGVEKKVNKMTRLPYYRIHAILDGQDEAIGWADSPDGFSVDDEVMYFFDPKWDQAKMSKLDTSKR